MIELRKITLDNFEAVLDLELADEQEEYVDSAAICLATAYVEITNNEKPPMPFAIYNGDEVVGLVMMGFHQFGDGGEFVCEEYELLHKDFGDKAIYEISGIIIDQKHQGKGFGRQAMMKALDFLRSFPQGKADSVFIICITQNETARKFFASFGFVEVGCVMDGETVLRLGL